MNMQIDDIIDQVFNKTTGVSREDIARVFKSQFKLTQETVSSKSDKTVNWIYIGKVKPTKYRLTKYKEKHEQV